MVRKAVPGGRRTTDQRDRGWPLSLNLFCKAVGLQCFQIGPYSRPALDFFRHNQPMAPVTDTDQTASHNGDRIVESRRVSVYKGPATKSVAIPFWDAL